MTSGGRKVSIREEERSVDVRIDDVPVHVAKLGPDRYHSHVFMFRDFDSLDQLVEAMIAEEGTLWLLRPPPPGEHTHRPPEQGGTPGRHHDHG